MKAQYLFVFALAVVIGVGEASCPQKTITNLTTEDNGNTSILLTWDITGAAVSCTSDSGAGTGVGSIDGIEYRNQAVQCASKSGALIFRYLNVTLRTRGSVIISNFSISNPSITPDSLIELSGFTIRDKLAKDAKFTYQYAPNALIAGNGSNAVVLLKLTGQTKYPIKIAMNFTCSYIYRFVPGASLLKGTTWWGKFVAYIQIIAIIVIIILVLLIRYCKPRISRSVRRILHFRDVDDDESEKIKDRAGGGTWYDHASEVVSDFKKDKLDEQEARMETGNVNDEELDNFDPVVTKSSRPRPPLKEESESVHEDDITPRAAPPKRGGKGGNDLEFEASEGGGSDGDL